MISSIYIRVDGSAQIGLGHIVRCIALAQMLQSKFNITFISKEIPSKLAQQIECLTFNFCKIKNENEFFNKLKGNEIVVLDNYFYDAGYQQKVKKYGSKLVCIDDVQVNEFYADLILCQIPGITPEDYQGQVYTEYLLGTEYVLLRPLFLRATKVKKCKRKNSLLICFGGSDYNNLTQRSLLIALDLPFDEINVVLGIAYERDNNLMALAAQNQNINIYHNLSEEDLLTIMLDSKYAIVPSSGILLEVLSAGCNVISGYYINNQRKVFEAYNNLNIIYDAGNFSEEDILKAYYECLNNSEFNNKNPIDGNSGKRILKVFEQLSMESGFKVRRMIKTDVSRTYSWATNSEIRKYSFSQHLITIQEHTNWFYHKISDINSFYYAISYSGNIVGSIRFDIKNNEAIISYLVDPVFQGKGYGQIILKVGTKQFLEDYKGNIDIVGYVMQNNYASIKIFERAGYSKIIESEHSYKFIKKMKNENR